MTVLTFGAVPKSAVVEYETTWYTSWECVVCRTWHDRLTPVRAVYRKGELRLMCVEHDSDDVPAHLCDCDCHIPHVDECSECGHYP